MCACVYMYAMDQRRARRAAIDAILSDPDMVVYVLKGNVGPSTFSTASLVCKTWRSACLADEALLRAVAEYQGALTKTAFVRLFAVSWRDVAKLPHEQYARYALFGPAAVDAALAAGLEAWRQRLRARASSPYYKPLGPTHLSGTAHEHEERLHARAVRRVAQQRQMALRAR